MTPPPDPILDGAEIQGDILAGFRKDNVRLLFISVPDAAIAGFKAWIKKIAGTLAYLDAVLGFNVKFSAERRRLAADPPMQATWMNLAISGQGAKRLLTQAQWSELDQTFLDGPLDDAALVGEPAAGTAGGPQTWIVGSPGNAPDALLIIAGDDINDVAATAASRQNDLSGIPGVTVHVEVGTTRAAEPGHEHFGFKDSISQPGVRGKLGSAAGPPVTRRVLDPKDPLYASFSAPGQPLCWPGEFVLGYPRKVEGGQDPNQTVTDPTTEVTRNGSYLVYRRLRQDVPGFNSAVAAMAAQISQNASFGQRTPGFAAACLIGRWPSGAPLMRSPTADAQALGNDAYASNNFFFTKASAPPVYTPQSGAQPDTFPQAKADTFGTTCPYAAHIRKINPRDQNTDQGAAVKTLEHRILRRGVPYGPDYDPTDPNSEAQDRGLQFICYQSSIQRGFQFLMNQWANSSQFPLGRGNDIVIGQDGQTPRQITILAPDGTQIAVNFSDKYVKTTGAAYLFSPSRTSLINCFAA
ncbi:MAG TPA: Dyp-type peroxidase [Stellaceae bacterium]|nr:Dyp-type peroxidase [Stellaceae bacterium]